MKAPDVGRAARGLLEFLLGHATGESMSWERQMELGIMMDSKSCLAGLFFSRNVKIMV